MSTLFSEARVPTAMGTFRLRIYEDPSDAGPIAIVSGENLPLEQTEDTLVHLHRACFLSENLGFLGCDCRQRLDFALQQIAARGGVVIYLRDQASGQGLADQIHRGACRFSADSSLPDTNLERASFERAALVLKDLGVQSVQLVTGDPGDAKALAEHGISVTGQVEIDPEVHRDAPSLVGVAAGLLD
jgi:3,4-dihydroxy 2-butanone 4-phosphate synthase/GTP cyclohydrolase II